MVITDDEALAERVIRLRAHGQSSPYFHEEVVIAGWRQRIGSTM